MNTGQSAKIIPRALPPGGRIGIFAPAAPIRREFLERGVAWLTAAGFTCDTGRYLYRRCHHLAGSREERCNDFNTLLLISGIAALFAARGGYGCLHLLPGIDYRRAADAARIILGFSDITALQLALWHKIRLVSFSGPMPAVEMARPGWVNEALLWALLMGAEKEYLNSLLSRYLESDEIAFLRPGTVAGPALGGNLTVLASLAGTPYLPDFSGAVVFLEDRGEPLYRIDRALSQLRLAGVFRAPAAVVCGRFTELRPDEEILREEFLRHFFAADLFPVVLNFHYGHCLSSFILPQGVNMQIACQERRICLLERPVVSDSGG